ncbi:atrial natriuretic peptide receptor 1-like protein, partial [Dinothrombium tinctorium]
AKETNYSVPVDRSALISSFENATRIENETTDSHVFEVYLVALFVADSELPVSQETTYPALVLAAEEANRRYEHINFNLVLKNSSKSCFINDAGVLAAEQYYLDQVHAFIGPACSIALNTVGRMASYWNVPVFTAGGIGAEFSDKSIFSTLTRLSFSADKIAEFVITIIKEFDWHHLSILYDESELSMTIIYESFVKIIRRHSNSGKYEMHLEVQHLTRRNNQTVDLKISLTNASRVSRVFILVMGGELMRELMLNAYDLGMNNGEYVFIAIELIKQMKEGHDEFSWFRPNDRRNNDIREMYKSLLVVSVRVPTSRKYQEFILDVIRVAKSHFNQVLTPISINPMLGAFYDALLMYAWALNQTLAAKEDPSNGRKVARKLWNRMFFGGISNKHASDYGLTGDVYINANGDRESDYTLNDMDPETYLMQPVATFYGFRQIYERHEGMMIHWPTENGEAPLDVPYCGFMGDAPKCAIPAGFPVAIMAPILSAFVLLVGVFFSFLLYKKIKLETDLANNWWKVKWEEIAFPSHAVRKSTTSLGVSEVSFGTKQSSGRQSMTSMQSSMNTTAQNITGILVGYYKGIKVAVKQLNIQQFEMTREILLDLKYMRDITHENLTRFVGLCDEPPNCALLIELCTRGSLRDMLDNEAFSVDWTFKFAMITDIVEGMTFLHSSIIEYHGRLKSYNCVIDGRFVVKITDYGLRSIHAMKIEEEEINPRYLFWTAPEHLREKDPLHSGSKQGDVYSFAIILQELIQGTGPFEAPDRAGRKKQNLDPDEILDRLRIGTTPPFRPEIASDECPQDLLDLMHACWAEYPSSRPEFSTIKSKLKRITK